MLQRNSIKEEKAKHPKINQKILRIKNQTDNSNSKIKMIIQKIKQNLKILIKNQKIDNLKMILIMKNMKTHKHHLKIKKIVIKFYKLIKTFKMIISKQIRNNKN